MVFDVDILDDIEIKEEDFDFRNLFINVDDDEIDEYMEYVSYITVKMEG